MELANMVKRGILQCEERYKFKLEQEKKTPIQRYSHIYKFGLFVFSILKNINRELSLFVPITEDTPCFIVERGGKNLDLKEIFRLEMYESIRADLKELDKYYTEKAAEFEGKFIVFEYDIYKRKRSEITKIIWRLLAATTSTKYQKAQIIIRRFTIPDFYRNITLPEGYLFIFPREVNIDRTLNESGLSKIDTVIYNDYIRLYGEKDYTFPNKRYDIEKMPGSFENRVFIGGNYDFMATLNYIKTVVSENGFIPILAFDFNVNTDNIHNYDIRLLANCKYCIFEVTKPEGDLMEIERAKDFQNHILLLYQVRNPADRNMPPYITSMLSTLEYELLQKKGYNQHGELHVLIKDWLEELKKVPFRY